ncbi:transposase [Ferrovum myxofaciens]|uniref:transposase n=1 Tax=Ferrovum myxofaciens TaxID=416213 RepID=UPI002356E515|nr:transposase [Ferrovum myxofaciens]
MHLVMDNLNTHFRKCFEEVLGVKKAKALLRRVVFHYTPKHASWLNMAEIEIGILDRQCLDQRLPDQATIIIEVNAWQTRRNMKQRGIEWKFTRQDADTNVKLGLTRIANFRVTPYDEASVMEFATRPKFRGIGDGAWRRRMCIFGMIFLSHFR